MTRILVVPEQLRSLSTQLRQTSRELNAISGRVGGALGELDWEARQKAGVDGVAGDARSRASALASQAETMAQYLIGKAQAFEAADQQGAAALPSVPTLPFPTPVPTPTIQPWPFPALIGITLPFIPSLVGIKWPPQISLPLPRIGLPSWLDNILHPTPPSSTPVATPTPAAPFIGPQKPTPQAPNVQPIVGPVKTPYASQWDPLVQSGRANCGPASLAMVIGQYGHATTTTDVASQVRDSATGYTDFKSDKAKELLDSYSLTQHDVNSLNSLQKQLEQGHPTIMLVDNKEYMRQEDGRSVPYPANMGFEAHHIVVVTGYELGPDGKIQSVYINDPLAVKKVDGQYVADPEGGTHFSVPIEAFVRAAGNTGWYGSAVAPKSI